ncbi:hypothetical protein GAYE_SCF55G6328 [Galdieria yellowstonensis]|uniref:Uncharacterized protein n=1 Tax=Galdieria yellowstonensis TaxID=3028027 RepID=A0AAV9ILM6_9RHOD|nr:hypothetical protein GAYE_SCF55G6328 [Galdieria yellowstonensis]
MNIVITTLSFLLILLATLVSGLHNCSCYVYVGGYYGQQPYLLGNIQNMTSCTNCTQETCQSTFTSVLEALEQYYNYAYPFYIYPYCPVPPVTTSVQTQVSEVVQENVQVSSSLPNVNVSVTSVEDVTASENVKENYYYPSYGYNNYGYYPWDYYGNYYYYYYYPYPTECCQSRDNHSNVSRKLDTIETQIQSIIYMLDAMNETSEIDGIATNLTTLYDYVMMFGKNTSSSLNATQTLLESVDKDMKSNFTKVYYEMTSLGKNFSKDSNYTKKELHKILSDLEQLNATMTSDNKTTAKEMDEMEKNISRLSKEYSALESQMATNSYHPSQKVVSSGSTSPTAIAGVVLGSIAVAGIVVVVVLVVMRIII